MDDLISQIRSTQQRHSDDNPTPESSAPSAPHVQMPQTLLDEAPQDPFDQENVPDLPDAEEDTSNLHDPTSSQIPVSFHIMKLDFDVLAQLKRESAVEITIDDAKAAKEYRLEGALAGIIKRLDAFGSDAFCLELVDESGSIYGSCHSALVNGLGLKTGTILLLSQCALWKVNGNHLNIVATNVVKVI